MFDPDIHFYAPDAGIIAEIGIDPRAVREVIEHDRVMRCPDRDQVLRTAATPAPFGPVPARRPAAWREEEL